MECITYSYQFFDFPEIDNCKMRNFFIEILNMFIYPFSIYKHKTRSIPLMMTALSHSRIKSSAEQAI